MPPTAQNLGKRWFGWKLLTYQSNSDISARQIRLARPDLTSSFYSACETNWTTFVLTESHQKISSCDHRIQWLPYTTIPCTEATIHILRSCPVIEMGVKMAQQPLLLQVICDFATVTHVPHKDTHLCETTWYRTISQLLARSLVSRPSKRTETFARKLFFPFWCLWPLHRLSLSTKRFLGYPAVNHSELSHRYRNE